MCPRLDDGVSEGQWDKGQLEDQDLLAKPRVGTEHAGFLLQ